MGNPHKPNKVHLGATVTEITDALPCLVIQGLERVHVIPRRTLEDVAEGLRKWSDIEDGDDMMPAILGEWLQNFRG